MAWRWRVSNRSKREVSAIGRIVRRNRRPAGKGAGLHSIPRNDRTARALSHRGVWPSGPGFARRNAGGQTEAVGGRISTRRWAAFFRAFAEGRRDRPEFDGRYSRDSLRSLVEPGRRES